MSETTDSFTDANGTVCLHGQPEPLLQVVGFMHRHPCEHYAIATVRIGEPYLCDCGGTPLIGWREWWPLPDLPPGDAIVLTEDDDR